MRLERMGDDEIELLLNEAPVQVAPAPEETLAFVQDLMAQAGVSPRTAPRPRAGSLLKRVAQFEPMSPDSYPLRSEPALMPADVVAASCAALALDLLREIDSAE